MHPAEYASNRVHQCAKTGHPITETRETQLHGVTLTYQTCKCGVKSRV